MQRSISRAFCFLIFKFIFCTDSYSQSIGDIMKLADERYSQKEYSEAADYYQRVVFFDAENSFPEAFEKTGNCFFYLRNYESATKFFDLAYYSTKNDSIRNELILKKTSALLLSGKHQFALMELLHLKDDLAERFEKKKYFYSAIAYFALEDYLKSEESFLKAASDDSSIREINELFRLVEKADKLNPRKAKILSMCFPGLGQFYSGDIKNGINSILITSFFAGLYLTTSVNFTFIEGYLVVFPWFQRYYAGGYKSAEKIAVNRKRNKKAELYQQILSAVDKG
jgi:tetratricopeptide (TPR) repeat protein